MRIKFSIFSCFITFTLGKSENTTPAEYEDLLRACVAVGDTEDHCIDLIYELQNFEYIKNFYSNIPLSYSGDPLLDHTGHDHPMMPGKRFHNLQHLNSARTVGLNGRRRGRVLNDKNAMYAFKRGGAFSRDGAFSRGRDMWKRKNEFMNGKSAFGGLENFLNFKKRNGDDFMFGKRHESSPSDFRMAGMGEALKRSARPMLPFPLLSRNDEFHKRGINFGDFQNEVGLFKRSPWYHNGEHVVNLKINKGNLSYQPNNVISETRHDRPQKTET